MSDRLTPEREARYREWVKRGDGLDPPEAAELLAEIDALRAERDRLRVCIVEMAIPYEALRLDAGSRKWIAPVVWQHIIDATTAARAALPGGTE